MKDRDSSDSNTLNHCGLNCSLNIVVQILMITSQLKKVFRVIPLRLKRMGLFCIVSFCLVMLEDIYSFVQFSRPLLNQQ
jgi:hypothetical protein